MAAADSIKMPPVTSQKGAKVGDDNMPDPREATVDVNTDAQDAQVVAKRDADPSKVYVHETSIQLDEVITDPSSPLAVLVPDAGRGSLTLPIHGLDAPRPDDVFAKEAKSESTPSDEDRQKAASEGRMATDVKS